MVRTVYSRGVAKEGEFSVCKVQSFLHPPLCPTPDDPPYSHSPPRSVITNIIQNLCCFLWPGWSLSQRSICAKASPFLGVFTSYT